MSFRHRLEGAEYVNHISALSAVNSLSFSLDILGRILFVRVVASDSNHTLSFIVDRHTVSALVAACASEPQSVEALLLAAESFEPGISDRVMDEMMRFDLWMQGGATKVRLLRPEPGREPALPRAFEVVDPLTRGLAYTPDDEGLVVVDLENREITTPDQHIQLPGRYGSVVRRDPSGDLEIETVYTLGPAWTVAREPVLASVGGDHG